MLIDNKHDYLDLMGKPSDHIKSVMDYILKYAGLDSGRHGTFDIVTGFFSIAGLDLLYRALAPNNEYRLVLSELTGNDDFMSRVINLLQGDVGIESSLRLNQAARNAIAFLRRETVEVKAITQAFCHAKAYIYKDSDENQNLGDKNFYVMGSSNLTEAGLGMRETSNVELNFAKTGYNEEYVHLRKWFDFQWQKVAQAAIPVDPRDKHSERVDVKEYFIKRIEECFNRVYTPEEIYYKILFELFAGDMDLEGGVEDGNEMVLLRDSTIFRTLFDYQKKGVISLIKMLRKWNGAILADAVGLGKTFSALAVMKYFQNNGYQVLMLCPKKLEQNWKQYLRRHGSRFERDEFDYIVRFHTDLQDRRLDKDDGVTLDWIKRQQKLLVVVDESHNLRNDKSSRYEMLLKEILAPSTEGRVRDVKTLLLSATPINNGLNDIRNQFRLIAKGNNKAFEIEEFDIKNLDSLFYAADQQFKSWCERENRTIGDFVDALSPEFFTLTDKLIVARTRDMIERTLGENLGFPRKERPENLYVGLERLGNYQTIADVYDAMLGSRLTAYQPTKYMDATRDNDGRSWQDNTYREEYLVKMMSVLFMKRLESCWFSCLTTIKKVLDVHERTLEKVDAFLAHRNAGQIQIGQLEGEEVEDFDEQDFTLRDNTINLAEMDRINDFRRDLAHDVEVLREFHANLDGFKQRFDAGLERDAKLDQLVGILARKQNQPNKKAIVFTTFGDTAQYMYDAICRQHPDWRVACVTGQEIIVSEHCDSRLDNDRFLLALRRFAPYSKLYCEKDWSDLYGRACERGLLNRASDFNGETRKWTVTFDKWKELVSALEPECQKILDKEIDVLIATDCLSEGQNLQDSDMVINYDIHWNPVRLIQRFGRIDRIGSPNQCVKAVNFWPASSYDEVLSLARRINNKMALMRIVGTETQRTDEQLETMVRDDPLIDHNTQKLLDQIANADINEIEGNGGAGDNQNLGLQNLSMEIFRQDILDYFEKNRELFRKMPAGVFSGFKLQPDLFENIPESLVAVLGYPHRRPEDFKKPYEHVYLMLQPAGDAPAEWKELSKGGILTFLRQNKSAKTDLPEWIVKSDAAMIGKLSQILKNWMKVKAPAEAEAAAEDFFSASVPTARVKTAAENVFKPENFDLIAWEYVSR